MESIDRVSTSWKLKFCPRIIPRQGEMLHQTTFPHKRGWKQLSEKPRLKRLALKVR